MRKPKEQVDEEGNEAHFFEDFESSDDVDNSDDDSGTRDPRKPKKPARQRVELRSEAQCLAAAAVRLGRLRARRLRHEAVVCRATATTWRAYTHKFLRIRRCRERQAQAQTFCCAAGCSGTTRLHRRAAARRRNVRPRVPARPLPPLWRRRAARARGRRHPHARQGRNARRVPRESRAEARLRRDDPHLQPRLVRSDLVRVAERRDSRAARRPSQGEAVASLASGNARLRRVPAAGRQARAARPRSRLAAETPATRAGDHGLERNLPLPRNARCPRDQCR